MTPHPPILISAALVLLAMGAGTPGHADGPGAGLAPAGASPFETVEPLRTLADPPPDRSACAPDRLWAPGLITDDEEMPAPARPSRSLDESPWDTDARGAEAPPPGRSLALRYAVCGRDVRAALAGSVFELRGMQRTRRQGLRLYAGAPARMLLDRVTIRTRGGRTEALVEWRQVDGAGLTVDAGVATAPATHQAPRPPL